MSLHNRIAVACALAAAVLVGATTLTSAEPGQKKKKPAAGAPTKKMIESGKEIYTATGCAACHKISGKGGVTSTDLTKIGKRMKPDKLKKVIREGAKGKTGVVMPPYGPDKISDKDMKDLLAYLGSLK